MNCKDNKMNSIKLKQIIREEVSKALHEGAILNAITPRLEGEVKAAVAALEKELQSMFGVRLDNKSADRLAYCIIDIIDAAKQEANDEYAAD